MNVSLPRQITTKTYLALIVAVATAFIILLIAALYSVQKAILLLFVVCTLVLITSIASVVTKKLTFPMKACTNIKLIKKGYYYIDFSQSFGKKQFKELIFDAHGIPQYKLCNKLQYFPTFVGWYACMLADQYLKTKNKQYKERFASQIAWIKKNAANKSINGKEYSVWCYNFDFQEGKQLLKQPWVSALGQGACISALVRDYCITGNKASLALAEKAAQLYHVPIKQGGIAYYNEHEKLYYVEEYPLLPQPKIFDGFVFALLAVYDLSLCTSNKKYKQLFDKYLLTIERNLELWTYKKLWSSYGSYRILSTVSYNQLNTELLKVLAVLTENKSLQKKFLNYVTYWDATNKNYVHKILIQLYFYATRIRYLLKNR